MKIPPPGYVPQSLDQFTDDEVRELALAYLDLNRLLLEGIDACETNTCVVGWSGRGYTVNGHGHTDRPKCNCVVVWDPLRQAQVWLNGSIDGSCGHPSTGTLHGEHT